MSPTDHTGRDCGIPGNMHVFPTGEDSSQCIKCGSRIEVGDSASTILDERSESPSLEDMLGDPPSGPPTVDYSEIEQPELAEVAKDRQIEIDGPKTKKKLIEALEDWDQERIDKVAEKENDETTDESEIQEEESTDQGDESSSEDDQESDEEQSD